jgi:polyphosphate kinase 2
MRPNASVATILSSGYSYYQQDNQKYYLHTPNLQLNPLPQETHLMNDRVNQTSLNPNEGNLEATRNNETQQANQQSEAIKKNALKKIKNSSKKTVKKRALEKKLKPYQAELIRMQQYLEKNNKRMIILFEGRDASGKGGTIRRVTRYMNEKNYRVVALGKPTDRQRSQWFYQKYVEQFPHGGEVVLFDRSWYNRAMVEPVFGFCTEKEYKNFIKGVKGFEKDLVRQGTILVKLYFSVTKKEQAKRFDRRKNDPLRQWKLSEVDIQAQERWDDFTTKKYEMFRHTHTSRTPWTVIRSNNKHLARLNAMKSILNSVPYKRFNPDLDFVPDHRVVISGSREVELMEADLLRKGKFIR